MPPSLEPAGLESGTSEERVQGGSKDAGSVGGVGGPGMANVPSGKREGSILPDLTTVLRKTLPTAPNPEPQKQGVTVSGDRQTLNGTFGVGGYGTIQRNGKRGGGTPNTHAPRSRVQEHSHVHNRNASGALPLAVAALVGTGIALTGLAFHRFGEHGGS